MRLERERIVPEIPKPIIVIRRTLLFNKEKVEAENRVITLRMTVKTPRPKRRFFFIFMPPSSIINNCES